jgi:hypothetical protein
MSEEEFCKETERSKPGVNTFIEWLNYNLVGKGAALFRPKGSVKDEDWWNAARDFSRALDYIPQTASSLTFMIVSGDKAKEEAAYYICDFFRGLSALASDDNIAGLSMFREIYDKIVEDEALAHVWQIYTGIFTQMIYAHIFSTRSAAIGFVPTEELRSITWMTTLMESMSETDKNIVMDILKKQEIWPPVMSTRPYRAVLDDLLTVSRNDYTAWTLENERRAQKAEKRTVQIIKVTNK